MQVGSVGLVVGAVVRFAVGAVVRFVVGFADGAIVFWVVASPESFFFVVLTPKSLHHLLVLRVVTVVAPFCFVPPDTVPLMRLLPVENGNPLTLVVCVPLTAERVTVPPLCETLETVAALTEPLISPAPLADGPVPTAAVAVF